MEEKSIQVNLQINNTLSVIEETNSKDEIISYKNRAQNENISIKGIKYFKNAEEYYSYNFPEYKLFRFCNILFCKMGELTTFGFDKLNNFKPKYSIGPNWYMTLILNILIIFISFILEFLLIKKLKILFQILFIIFLIITIASIDYTALLHTEIVMNKSPNSFNNTYCNKCKKYYNPLENVDHCSICKVCVIKLDHHCVWVGKCVGKDNLFAFYRMIIFGSIFYLYMIICVILYYMK